MVFIMPVTGHKAVQHFCQAHEDPDKTFSFAATSDYLRAHESLAGAESSVESIDTSQ